MTNVPSPTISSTGFVPPTEVVILAGVEADLNAAFGTTLNFGTVVNPTPQGQIATTMTAVIGNANDTFCSLANMVDPAFATGRWQDAIGRIYFISRSPGRSTVVACACIGLPNTVILPGALVQAEDGNLYFCLSGGTIPIGGSITLEFACQTVGPVTCPAHSVNVIFRSVPGWDSIDNPSDGVLGINVESRAAFETRREASVGLNSTGFIPSILGNLLGIAGVLDAYVTDNPNQYDVAQTPAAIVTGTVSGTSLTIASIVSGEIEIGQTVTGASGSNVPVESGTVIESGSGTSWVVNHSQTVALTSMNLGGVVLGPHELYIAAVGGDETDVATAIWNKKSPGCPYWGPANTSVTIFDTSVQYPPPGVPYVVKWEQPPSLPFVIVVNIANSPLVPSDAQGQIQQAVVNAFSGADGRARITIGSVAYANRFYPGINALGTWAEIVSLFLGVPSQPTANVTASMGATFTGSASGTTTLTAGSVVGYLSPGDTVTGPGVPTGGVTVVAQLSGATGGNGTYQMSQALTLSSASLSSASSVLDVTAVASGTVEVTDVAFDLGSNELEDGTTISALGTGTGGPGTYATNSVQQNVPSESMQLVKAALTRVGITIDQAPTVTPACIQVNLV